MAIILTPAFQCERCFHRWLPRNKGTDDLPQHQPQVCPKCKSPYWNKPRQKDLAPDRRAARQGHTDTPLPTAPSPTRRLSHPGPSRTRNKARDTA